MRSVFQDHAIVRSQRTPVAFPPNTPAEQPGTRAPLTSGALGFTCRESPLESCVDSAQRLFLRDTIGGS
jgi:hypothetical protein